jgi:hypothetical protein
MILTYIEQLLNDGLLFDELTGRISISRKFAIYEVSDLVEFHA